MSKKIRGHKFLVLDKDIPFGQRFGVTKSKTTGRRTFYIVNLDSSISRINKRLIPKGARIKKLVLRDVGIPKKKKKKKIKKKIKRKPKRKK